jgi:peptidoglycan/LPS O-acetylase OafA/YrhL
MPMDTFAKRWTSRLARVTTSGNFIPEIDGLRFLAIASVLLFHASYALQRAFVWEPGTASGAVSNLFARGALGVELFFVISGFILAVPFAKHFVEGGKVVDLRRYYLRRITRLEPPYIITLVVFYAAAWLTHDAALQGRLLPTFLVRLFYLHGLVYQDAPVLNGVTWSLEIEVQFYLIVPLLARVFCMPAKIRRILMLLVVVGMPLVPLQGILLFSVLSQLGLFFAGFLFADFYLEMRRNQKLLAGNPIYDWPALGLFAVVLLFPFIRDGLGPYVADGGNLDYSMRVLRRFLPVMILIFLLLMFRGVWLRRFFSWKPVYLIGGMCYSIYLIHYPLISTVCRLLAKIRPEIHYLPALALMVFIWLPVVLAIATAFFVLIEHPCMDPAWPRKLAAKIKSRFH